MTFDAPIPFLDAINWIARKLATPTDQSSMEIAAAWSKESRQLALYSARTDSAHYLDQIPDVITAMLDGSTNEATARLKLQQWLASIGYTPEHGFPGGSPNIPPADPGTLRDLGSEDRLRLIIQTLTRHASNTAFAQAGMAGDRLYQFPCWEFLRVFPRRVPRGSTDRVADLGWPERWVRSGGTLYGGRMIAPKDSPVWAALSDSGVWSDGMDSDVPPFAYNSGYGITEVPRGECIALGVIAPDFAQPARTVSLLGQMFDEPPKATLADINAKKAALLDALHSFHSLEEAA